MKAYQMKIQIKDSHPPIWRRFIVPAGLTFSQLSFVLNEVMGWCGQHLSQFDFYHLGIQIEENPETPQYGDREILDAIDTPIEPFMDNENWFTYIYDFGDYWQHRVEIEKILPAYEADYPVVLKYKGNTPYEDCGGLYGYYELLRILEDPEDPQYEEMCEWTEGLSADYDLEEVNGRLKNYHLSEEPHDPMSLFEIYQSCLNNEPLYTITDISEEEAVREEALLEEWDTLYKTAMELKELKPWERFWDMDLIELEGEDDPAFAVILGRNGTCYGISIYEGLMGLNDYMMLCQRKELNLSETYAGFSQNNLTCYWGDREELSEEQRQIIKSLGYKFRGRNQWLYFISHKTGYFPYNMDAAEVRRMTSYLSQLIHAIRYYYKEDFKVDFEHGNLFCFSHDPDTGSCTGREQPLPFVSYNFWYMEISDEAFTRRLRELPQKDYSLDVHIEYVPAPIDDARYERPGIVRLLMLADTDTGIMLTADLLGPDEVEGEALVQRILSLMGSSARPREIRVCNDIMKHYISSLCKAGNIKLRKRKNIPVFQKFLKSMEQRMY